MYANAAKKFLVIDLLPCACKIPTVIGIIGYTQGVKLNSNPNKNTSNKRSQIELLVSTNVESHVDQLTGFFVWRETCFVASTAVATLLVVTVCTVVSAARVTFLLALVEMPVFRDACATDVLFSVALVWSVRACAVETVFLFTLLYGSEKTACSILL